MEIFKLYINGSFKFSFRKSLPLTTKEKMSNDLCNILKLKERGKIHKIIKGNLIVYDTPNVDNIKKWCEILHAIETEKYIWDSHVR